jgi:threonine synthase
MTTIAGAPVPARDAAARLADMPTRFVCDGCGFEAPPGAPVPLRCPAARPGDDVDHVLRRTLDPSRIAFPATEAANPFETYRTLFHAYHVARALGQGDADYVALVRGLDEHVAVIDGHGFMPTPLVAHEALRERLAMTGRIVVKDETGNVAGSHKARHLMGTAVELEIGAALNGRTRSAPLAIASCGNAALAAAVVAAAWGRELHVFVPTEAEPAILLRLTDLRARVTVVQRDPHVPGDPTYRALRRAVDGGAIPFTCQGPENAFAIEGGETLGYELVAQLAGSGTALDRLFVQVGGGALAASVAGALDESHALGRLERLPRIHAVQSRNVQPLVRAYRHVVEYLAPRLGIEEEVPEPGAPPGAWHGLADRLRDAVAGVPGDTELATVPRRRSSFMWPWEGEPRSVAGGIVDDETYDWFAVVRAMLRTGGFPVVADEAGLRAANALGRATTGIDADPTGTAGLAGFMALHDSGGIDPAETIGLLFTGVRRIPASGDS